MTRGVSLLITLLFLVGVSVGCGPECPEGQTKCGETCVNTQTDRANCGTCGTACKNGEVCSAGKCATSCQEGLTLCEGRCANTKTDRTHCGACGTVCKDGEVCKDGKCEISCPDKQTACSGTCVDTQTSLAHCGACGTACAQGEICKAGKCEITCTKNQTACDGTCVDTQSNLAHCGACGTKCDPGQVCSAGKCATSCQKDLTDCNGACVNTQTDNAHCGKCDTKCDAGQICKAGKCELNCGKDYEVCGGVCINTQISREHCGKCDTKCEAGQICNAGKCELNCQTGLTSCSDKCVNTQNDTAHCGQCGTACKTGEVCQSGKCELFCQTGFTNCSGACADTNTDSKNCGACGTVCKTGETCQSGKCEVPINCPSGETACSKACVDLSSDAANCGACGTACQAGEACLQGTCKPCRDCATWAVNVGAYNSDYVRGVAVDSKGNVYAVGYFDTVARFGSFILQANGTDPDLFVVKMSPTGKVLWAKHGGGSSTDYGYGVAVDGTGNVYITGAIQSTATFGSIQLTSAGGYDIFVAKLDTTGKWLWAKNYGSTSSDYGYGIGVDSSGNAYVTGSMYSSVKIGTTTLSSQGGSDIFVAKWDKDGKELWAASAGSSSSEDGQAIAVDGAGNAYITGRFYSFITWGTTTLSSGGSSDAFVAKFDTSGALQWAASGGGSGIEYAYGIGIDSKGNVAVTGRFDDAGALFGSTTLKSAGDYDIFVAHLDNTGKWTWAVSAGGSDSDYGYGVGFDSAGNVYATGYFYEASTFGSLTLKPPEDSTSAQIFLMQIDKTGKVMGAIQAGGTSSDYAYHLVLDSKDNIYVGGYFNELAPFGEVPVLSNGGSDGFVAKYPKPAGSLCPQQGYSICSGACIDTSADAKNCGACGKACPTGDLCAGSQCVSPPKDVYLQEVNVGTTDYIAIKNYGTKDVTLAGLSFYLNYQSSFSSATIKDFRFPPVVLKAGATLYCVESSPKANEIKCPSIPLISSDDFVAMLCLGTCTESQSNNVLDAVLVGSGVPLPTGVSFSPAGVGKLTSSSQQDTHSYVRKSTTGKAPAFLQADWAVQTMTRP